jgi:hypothetical protein
MMDFDASRVNLWKEYFCRFDEGKKEQMTLQIQ